MNCLKCNSHVEVSNIHNINKKGLSAKYIKMAKKDGKGFYFHCNTCNKIYLFFPEIEELFFWNLVSKNIFVDGHRNYWKKINFITKVIFT